MTFLISRKRAGEKMDESIKNSIEARRNAITNLYDVKACKMEAKFNKLFEGIEKLGKESKDVMDFESKFAASPLNQEYLNFFTEIATIGNQTAASQPKPGIKASLEQVAEASGTTVGQMVAENVADAAASRIKQAVSPTRAQVNQAAYDAARDIPVVGEALNVKQQIDFLSRFKKK